MKCIGKEFAPFKLVPSGETLLPKPTNDATSASLSLGDSYDLSGGGAYAEWKRREKGKLSFSNKVDFQVK
jgi:hypothetical protein